MKMTCGRRVRILEALPDRKPAFRSPPAPVISGGARDNASVRLVTVTDGILAGVSWLAAKDNFRCTIVQSDNTLLGFRNQRP